MPRCPMDFKTQLKTRRFQKYIDILQYRLDCIWKSANPWGYGENWEYLNE